MTGAWIQTWGCTWRAHALKAGLVALLGFQAYAANFGVRWLPQEVVLLRGYSGSLRWDWNLYLQNYFHILGAPRREDWKQEEILRQVVEDARSRGVRPELALIPDLPRFNSANFHLLARLRGLPMRIAHVRGKPAGLRSFDGFNYVIMTEGEQGMPWTTATSRALNQILIDDPGTFRLVALYVLPGGNGARLYFIQHNAAAETGPLRSASGDRSPAPMEGVAAGACSELFAAFAAQGPICLAGPSTSSMRDFVALIL
jgi:hypothetical protein